MHKNLVFAAVAAALWVNTVEAEFQSNSQGLISSVPSVVSDSDEDGYPDAYESQIGTDPTINQVVLDTDGDGVNDHAEIVDGSDPYVADRTDGSSPAQTPVTPPVTPSAPVIAEFDSTTPFSVSCSSTTPGECIVTGPVPANASVVTVSGQQQVTGATVLPEVASIDTNTNQFRVTFAGLDHTNAWDFTATASGSAGVADVTSSFVTATPLPTIALGAPQPELPSFDGAALVWTESGATRTDLSTSISAWQGTGATTWTSNTPELCAVNEAGVVNRVVGQSGSCEISVSRASDATYQSATATFSFPVGYTLVTRGDLANGIPFEGDTSNVNGDVYGYLFRYGFDDVHQNRASDWITRKELGFSNLGWDAQSNSTGLSGNNGQLVVLRGAEGDTGGYVLVAWGKRAKQYSRHGVIHLRPINHSALVTSVLPRTGSINRASLDPSGFYGVGTSLALSGSAQVGSTLTARAAGFDGFSLSYQWLKDGAPISGETGSTYTTVADDGDASISVQVSFTDGTGTAQLIQADSSVTVGPALACMIYRTPELSSAPSTYQSFVNGACPSGYRMATFSEASNPSGICNDARSASVAAGKPNLESYVRQHGLGSAAHWSFMYVFTADYMVHYDRVDSSVDSPHTPYQFVTAEMIIDGGTLQEQSDNDSNFQRAELNNPLDLNYVRGYTADDFGTDSICVLDN